MHLPSDNLEHNHDRRSVSATRQSQSTKRIYRQTISIAINKAHLAPDNLLPDNLGHNQRSTSATRQSAARQSRPRSTKHICRQPISSISTASQPQSPSIKVVSRQQHISVMKKHIYRQPNSITIDEAHQPPTKSQSMKHIGRQPKLNHDPQSTSSASQSQAYLPPVYLNHNQ